MIRPDKDNSITSHLKINTDVMKNRWKWVDNGFFFETITFVIHRKGSSVMEPEGICMEHNQTTLTLGFRKTLNMVIMYQDKMTVNWYNTIVRSTHLY